MPMLIVLGMLVRMSAATATAAANRVPSIASIAHITSCVAFALLRGASLARVKLINSIG